MVLVPPPRLPSTTQVGYVVVSPSRTHKHHQFRQASVDVSNGGPISLAIRPNEGLLPYQDHV